MKITNCEDCNNFIYDEESETYYCQMDLDEDEYMKFISASFYNCPYYDPYDEYKIVRKQNQQNLTYFLLKKELFCQKYYFYLKWLLTKNKCLHIIQLSYRQYYNFGRNLR